MCKKNIYICVLLLVIIACSRGKETKDSGIIIDLTQKHDSTLLLSDIADTILYYPINIRQLRRPRFAWLCQNIQVTNHYILLTADGDYFLYDRKSGNFLKKSNMINPEEGSKRARVNDGVSSIFRNERYVLGRRHYWEKGKEYGLVLRYDLLENQLLDSFYYKIKETPLNMCFFNDSLLLNHQLMTNKVSLHTFDGQTIKTFDNIQYGITNYSPTFFFYSSLLYKVDNETFHIHITGGDTVYAITPELECHPAYIFYSGKKTIPAELRIYNKDHRIVPKKHISHQYHCIENVMESTRYLFAGLYHQNFYKYILYDKTLGQTYVLPSCPVTTDFDPVTFRFQEEETPELHAIPNDIDGGLTFWPRTVSETGELVTLYDPADLKKKLFSTDKNSIKDKAAYERLKQMLTELPEDEPHFIVTVVRLKK